MTASKKHYTLDGRKTVCGRPVLITTPMATDPYLITCILCRSSPLLDGKLGNMTHTGH